MLKLVHQVVGTHQIHQIKNGSIFWDPCKFTFWCFARNNLIQFIQATWNTSVALSHWEVRALLEPVVYRFHLWKDSVCVSWRHLCFCHVTTGSGLNDGQWHAVRLVAKENFAMLTIDGEETSSVRSTSPLIVTTGGTYHLGGECVSIISTDLASCLLPPGMMQHNPRSKANPHVRFRAGALCVWRRRPTGSPMSCQSILDI